MAQIAFIGITLLGLTVFDRAFAYYLSAIEEAVIFRIIELLGDQFIEPAVGIERLDEFVGLFLMDVFGVA